MPEGLALTLTKVSAVQNVETASTQLSTHRLELRWIKDLQGALDVFLTWLQSCIVMWHGVDSPSPHEMVSHHVGSGLESTRRGQVGHGWWRNWVQYGVPGVVLARLEKVLSPPQPELDLLPIGNCLRVIK